MPESRESIPPAPGVLVGSAIGGVMGVMAQNDVLRERGHTRVSPWFLPNVLVDSASGQIAIDLGVRGPNYAPVSACATGSHAVGEGAETIRRGDADVILAGGTESCMHPVILAGFCAMRGLLSGAWKTWPFISTASGSSWRRSTTWSSSTSATRPARRRPGDRRRPMTHLALSYDHLGRALNISGETVRRWERGTHPIPGRTGWPS